MPWELKWVDLYLGRRSAGEEVSQAVRDSQGQIATFAAEGWEPVGQVEFFLSQGRDDFDAQPVKINQLLFKRQTPDAAGPPT